MSTFSGYVPEIPYISIDRFEEGNKDSKMFFLSHCHSDHMIGLSEDGLRNMLFTNLNICLYASDISVRILRTKYCDLTMQLKELPIGVPFSVKVPCKFGEKEKILCVTTIPAGHCPGSVMFLFETEGKNILYTGDFRINTRDLSKYVAFHDSTGHIKKIHAMYLDTTFCSNMYEHFSPREESVEEICKLVDEWVSISDKHIIDLSMGAYYGSEYLLTEIFKWTKKPIHVLKEVYKLYKYMPEIAQIISTSVEKAKVHTRLNYYNSCCNVTNNSAYFVRTIRPSAIVWDYFETSGQFVKQESENSYRVCYSSHASLSEIKEFVSYLKPLRIIPCVVPDDTDERENLFTLLAEMIKEYRSSGDGKKEKCKDEPFPIVVVTKNKKVNTVQNKLNLLSSPPRNCNEKTCTSEVHNA